MNLKNANIGAAVGSLLILLGFWWAGWDVSEDEAPIIAAVSFLSGIGLTLALDERADRARDRRE